MGGSRGQSTQGGGGSFPPGTTLLHMGKKKPKRGEPKVSPECCQGWLVGSRVAKGTVLAWVMESCCRISSRPSLLDGLLTKGMKTGCRSAKGCPAAWPGPKSARSSAGGCEKWGGETGRS